MGLDPVTMLPVDHSADASSLLTHRIISADASSNELPSVDSDLENDGEQSAGYYQHGFHDDDGASVATGDISGYMDQPSLNASVYPVLTYESSSVLSDPRHGMMVVTEGPVDEDMQRAWLTTLEDGDGKSSLEREQRAGWYDSNATMPAKV